MSAYADVGKFHFTSSKARYFTMCAGTLFHVLRKQNISLYAFVSTNTVLPKTKLRTTKVYGYFANKQVCKNKRLPCVKGAPPQAVRD